MKFGNTFRKTLAMAALVAMSSLAEAGPYIGVGSVASFNLAVTPVATETFESVTPGLVSAQPAVGATKSIRLFSGVGQLSQSSIVSPARGAFVTSSIGDGRVNTTAGGAFWVESDADFTILLGRDVEAFGFYGTDFGDFEGGLSIALYKDGNAVVTDVFEDGQGGSLIPTFSASGGLTFLGYASSTKFDEIRFRIEQDNVSADDFDIYGFDDLTVGNLKSTGGNVPEPGSLALVGLALFAAGWARKTQCRA